MTEQEYLETRVDDQIKWYDKKSGWHKKLFMRLKLTETILALLIPLLTGYVTGNATELKIILGLIGITVAATASIITLYKFQENWIEYRTVAESLKHEKFLYITKAGPYKDSSSFSIFVERFESFISKENTQWASYTRPEQKEKQEGTAP